MFTLAGFGTDSNLLSSMFGCAIQTQIRIENCLLNRFSNYMKIRRRGTTAGSRDLRNCSRASMRPPALFQVSHWLMPNFINVLFSHFSKQWTRSVPKFVSAGLFKFVFNTILQFRLPWEIICLKSLPFSLFLREFYRESIRLLKTAMCQCGYRRINQVSVISFIIIIVETNYDFR